jgi:hypothetical protein
MEYKTGNKDDLIGILELLKQLSENADFSENNNLEDKNKIWDKIENNNIKY